MYVMLCYVSSCYVMSRYFMSCCHVMLCYVMLCYVMLCYVMLRYVTLRYVMLCTLCYVCYVMLWYYVILWYVMLCYFMLCYELDWFSKEHTKLMGSIKCLWIPMIILYNIFWDYMKKNEHPRSKHSAAWISFSLNQQYLFCQHQLHRIRIDKLFDAEACVSASI
jgi:hypothetical protein